ncbi:RRQRL motif-containing zinc-binding protein [Nocardia wallacei]|uniref:RRQRL motif-containing zinc-binding protein n=1 Tax=Nocardia wallacei TaxID=480035 RepID=UPI002454C49E|nr:RRQRL motif-containing zinc-binding protein [Nocardia wallacei]
MSEGIPTFRWRMAPQHLRTRRQLAAEGLRPNGQDIAGKVPFRRHGREYVAYLFDVGKSAPKRPATPAQLAALEKATREHQLRAAERHGIDRSEFEQAPENESEPEPEREAPRSALADYTRTGNALADAVGHSAEREGMDR